MCRNKQRIEADYAALYADKQKWYKRAWIMRAILRHEDDELRRITAGDDSWQKEWRWVTNELKERNNV